VKSLHNIVILTIYVCNSQFNYQGKLDGEVTGCAHMLLMRLAV